MKSLARTLLENYRKAGLDRYKINEDFYDQYSRFVCKNTGGREEEFSSFEKAEDYMKRYGYLNTGITTDDAVSDEEGDQVTNLIVYFVDEDDLPEDFDSLSDYDKDSAFDDIIGDGAYSPMIYCEK